MTGHEKEADEGKNMFRERGCGPLIVNGEKWLYAIGEPGPIEPGTHRSQCGEGWSCGIQFEVQEGTTSYCNCWDAPMT